MGSLWGYCMGRPGMALGKRTLYSRPGILGQALPPSFRLGTRALAAWPQGIPLGAGTLAIKKGFFQ